MIVTLKSVLRHQWESTQGLDRTPYAGGGKKKDRPLTPDDASQLHDDLKSAIRRNKPILWVVVALIALLLLAATYTASVRARTPGGVDWLSLSSGGILAFLISAAMRVWREVTRLEMMAAVAARVQGEPLTALIRLLLEGTDRRSQKP
ncbi:MAG: hypothetical protein ABSG53_28695 [Thermoguttaceae bacterium]|jgi:hypothetical protein